MGKRRHFGAIRRLPSGRYQARYLGPDGLYHTAPETFELKADAAHFLSLVEAQLARNEWRDPAWADVPLGVYAGEWIEQRPGLRPRTTELYRYLLRKHITPLLGGRRLGDFDNNPALIRSWRSELLASGVSASTVAKAYRLLRAVLMTAVDDDLIRRNPCRLPRAGLEVAGERPTLTAGQVAELAGRVPPRYSALILLTTYASLRWGEAIALRRRDLNLNTGTVRVRHSYSELSTGEIVLGPPKSRAGLRVVAFPRSLVPLLLAHLEEYAAPGDDGLVFPAVKGGPLRRSYFNRLVSWKAAVEAIGVPDLHFHDLRHTGNHLAAQVPGTTVRDLMQRMGHDNERAAMIYLHATQGADRRIADSLPVQLDGRA